jgi:hypothetical protein
MKLKRKDTETEHEVAYADLLALIGKHGNKIDALEMLAIASNVVGKIMAMQDQRTMTVQACLELIMRNIELGNQQAIAEILKMPTDGRPQ